MAVGLEDDAGSSGLFIVTTEDFCWYIFYHWYISGGYFLWNITRWNISEGMRTESQLLLHYNYCYISIVNVPLLPGGPG